MNEHTKILVDDILPPLAKGNKVSIGFRGSESSPCLTINFEFLLICHTKTFDAWPVITNCALDIICNSSMGYNIDAQHNAENSPYIWAIMRHSEITIDRIVCTFKLIHEMHL